jgi:hypothetical protein
VSFVDDNIGMILDALQQQGLAENTIVFILGDHGFHLGDHGFWSKYSMLEATRRAPLLVRVPGAPANGKVCREFVEFVDFVPTLAELAGLELPANLEGTSFAPLLVNPDQPWKKAVFMVESPANQVVRNKRFSYLEFQKGPIPAALYDLEKDPWETVNLADDPAYAKTRQEMSDLLKAGWKAALPMSGAVRAASSPEEKAATKPAAGPLRYAERMNLAAMTPRNDLASTKYCLANPAKQKAEYLVYLPEGGSVTVDLAGSEGALVVEWFDPKTGKTTDGESIAGGAARQFTAPFAGDAVLYLSGRP